MIECLYAIAPALCRPGRSLDFATVGEDASTSRQDGHAMPAERAQLHHTCIFLAVSFRAIRQDLETRGATPETPCWLDTRLIEMLAVELRGCRDAAGAYPAAREALDIALSHAALLLAQCPGALDRERCRRQLETVISPLQDAGARLTAARSSPPQANRWQAVSHRLSRWLRHRSAPADE
ncbi:hypothetical protein [Halomonas borealis]|uniref:hypothetical protein n=1 Tax=Halomonas borealis TaxID=2508710 RepID=UPI00109F4833|nr:hypothetical protein [Halomonas borealis]